LLREVSYTGCPCEFATRGEDRFRSIEPICSTSEDRVTYRERVQASAKIQRARARVCTRRRNAFGNRVSEITVSNHIQSTNTEWKEWRLRRSSARVHAQEKQKLSQVENYNKNCSHRGSIGSIAKYESTIANSIRQERPPADEGEKVLPLPGGGARNADVLSCAVIERSSMMATYAELRRERKTKGTAEAETPGIASGIAVTYARRAKFSAVCRIIAGLTVIADRGGGGGGGGRRAALMAARGRA